MASKVAEICKKTAAKNVNKQLKYVNKRLSKCKQTAVKKNVNKELFWRTSKIRLLGAI